MVLFLCCLCCFLYAQKDDITTLYGTETFHGQVACIVTTGQWRSDSIVFSYNNENKVSGYKIFENRTFAGYCEYKYPATNRIEQIDYDNNGKQKSYSIIDFDDKRNITMLQVYGYIYPDTINMKLLYKRCDTYNTDNRKESASEYFCDGTPPYRYRYTYDTNGTITEERSIASTGKIFTITRMVSDNNGNVVKVSEIMPKDTQEWQNATISYKYDSNGNWIERTVNGKDPRVMDSVRNCTRRIYYVDN